MIKIRFLSGILGNILFHVLKSIFGPEHSNAQRSSFLLSWRAHSLVRAVGFKKSAADGPGAGAGLCSKGLRAQRRACAAFLLDGEDTAGHGFDEQVLSGSSKRNRCALLLP